MRTPTGSGESLRMLHRHAGDEVVGPLRSVENRYRVQVLVLDLEAQHGRPAARARRTP